MEDKKFPIRYATPEISVENFINDYLSFYDNSTVKTNKNLIIQITNSDIKTARKGGTPNSIYLITDFGRNFLKQSFFNNSNENSAKKFLDTLVLAWGCDIRERCAELCIAENGLTWIGAFKGYLKDKKKVPLEDLQILNSGQWYRLDLEFLSKTGLEYMKEIKNGIPAPDISKFLYD